MYRLRAANAAIYLLLIPFITAPAFAGQPFNSCNSSIDGQGFIVVEDELPSRRFFPLASFFYPVIGWEMDPDNGGGQDLAGDYADFAGWGGNCVICPWVINDWFYGPGALFKDGPTNNAHLAAAYSAQVKLIADPTLFWGRYGSWPDGFNQVVNNADRTTMFNEFKGWCEAGYASALLGYWQWHEPAWGYWRYEGPPPARPTATSLTNAYTHLRYTLEGSVDAHHSVFMGQAGYVNVQELWRDYFKGSDCAAASIFPCPAPFALDNPQITPYLLPNYYCSVVGDLADVAQESARGNSPFYPGPRNQPYIAVLQGHIPEGESSLKQCRFMAYDAIIHGAKGLAWYTTSGGQPGDWYWPGKLYFLPVIQELHVKEVNYSLLTANYDSPLVRVITTLEGDEVERSAFVGGKLVPKSHFLSSKRIMEGCAKITEYQGQDYTFLIVACRHAPWNVSPTPPPFEVEFYPYYSAYDFDTTWPGPVYELTDVGPVPLAVTNGTWTGTFTPEEVKIYCFEKPAPWTPDNAPD